MDLRADGFTLTDDTWYDVTAYYDASVDVAISSGTCKVYGSNAQNKPSVGTDGGQVGADITADKIQSVINVGTPMRWLKIKKTTGNAATKLEFFGRRFKDVPATSGT